MVELMVGMAIGLILIAGLALMFANTSRSGNELDKSIRQIENGRYAVELLQEEISLAGYYAELPLYGVNYSLPAACDTSTAGFTLTTVPTPIVGITSTDSSATCLTNRITNTPAFIVHRLSTEGDPVTLDSVPAGTIYVQSSRCKTDAFPFIAAAASSAFVLNMKNCTTPNGVRRYVSRIYYLANCSECTPSDGIPTLTMAELRGTRMVSVPLVEGIENMLLEYGFDTNRDGQPDIFQVNLSSTPGADSWGNVVAVRINLIARTTERTAGYDDSGKTYRLGAASTSAGDTSGFKRRVYTSTVRIKNETGRRETVPYIPASS